MFCPGLGCDKARANLSPGRTKERPGKRASISKGGQLLLAQFLKKNKGGPECFCFKVVSDFFQWINITRADAHAHAGEQTHALDRLLHSARGGKSQNIFH